MKELLLDASVTANWIVDEKIEPAAQRAFELMQNGTRLFVPSLWVLEITNVLFNAERRRRISRQARDEALIRVETLPVTVFAPPQLIDIKMLASYAARHQLTSYDAEYLRLAKAEGLTLATLDKNLRAAAKKEKCPVLEPDAPDY